MLNRLAVLDADGLLELLAEIAEPPLDRLEAITERLEQTGEVTVETVNELKQIIATMSSTGADIDATTARHLAFAAEMFSADNLSTSASALAHAAEVLPGVVRDLNQAAARMEDFR